ncbi:metal-dependent hydrolase [Paenibacillus allorhizosphaerae]|nr:metal-dependent hydrolase [Paenibacillus allorhizosphaerae]
MTTTHSMWTVATAALVALLGFMLTRTLRGIVMFLLGSGLIAFGHSLIPWNYVIGSILVICSIVKHRGLTHTLYAANGWPVVLFFASHEQGEALWIAGGLSYLILLLCDILTDRGIQTLPPFKFRLKLQLMSTGTWTGKIVESLCVGLTCVFV